MKHKTAKVSSWQHIGGVLDIPDGWFIHSVNLDAEEPYCEITKDDIGLSEEKKLLIPKSLAYYLEHTFAVQR